MDTTTSKAEAPQSGEPEKKPKREQWTEAEARRVLVELRASGESIIHFARKRGFYPSRLYQWMNRLGERAKKKPLPHARFIPVTVAQPPRPERPAEGAVPRRPAAGARVTVEINGHLVHVERGFDPNLLRAVVTALEPREMRSC